MKNTYVSLGTMLFLTLLMVQMITAHSQQSRDVKFNLKNSFETAGDADLLNKKQNEKKGTLKGAVRDGKGKAVKEATFIISSLVETKTDVDIEEMAKFSFTSEKGEFQLPDFPEGQYIFRVEAEGYETIIKCVKIKSGKTSIKNFKLKNIEKDDSEENSKEKNSKK